MDFVRKLKSLQYLLISIKASQSSIRRWRAGNRLQRPKLHKLQTWLL